MRQMSLALSLAGLSFMMTVIWGPPLLRILRHFKIGKIIRLDEPGLVCHDIRQQIRHPCCDLSNHCHFYHQDLKTRRHPCDKSK